MDNVTWSRQIISQLFQQDVRHFCIAPGSRSTPLALGLFEEKDVHYTTHFDERGLGFYAFGLAKSLKKPVGIIVTSATAVGNLLPAVMEAWHDHVPLVLLTADRPPELRDCGANQTTDQVKIFHSFVHWQMDLPCPFPGSERYLASTVGYAVHQAKEGPVHLNCMFREPLAPPPTPFFATHPTRYYSSSPTLDTSTIHAFATLLAQHDKGMVVCGNGLAPSDLKNIVTLAEHLQWPILADVSSQLRGHNSSCLISCYDYILPHGSDLQPTAVIHCGGRLVSKKLQEWLQKIAPEIYVHVDNKRSRFDERHAFTDHFLVEPSFFCAALTDTLLRKQTNTWIKKWQTLGHLAADTFLQTLSSSSACSEPGIMACLQKNLTSEQALFIANSMPIRDANGLLFPKHAIGPVFTKRGLSGIDGNIATVAGLAYGCGKPIIAVLGDLAALHDLNSLALVKKSAVPILLLVINNAGGAIFSFLPHVAQTPAFEELFAQTHKWDFAHAASMFSIPYFSPPDQKDVDDVIVNFCTLPQTSILEVCTERKANYAQHIHIEELIDQQLRLALQNAKPEEAPSVFSSWGTGERIFSNA